MYARRVGGSARQQPATGSDSSSRRSIPFGSRSQLGKWMFSFLFHFSSSFAFPLPHLLLLLHLLLHLRLLFTFIHYSVFLKQWPPRLIEWLIISSWNLIILCLLLLCFTRTHQQSSNWATQRPNERMNGRPRKRPAVPTNLTEWFNDKKDVRSVVVCKWRCEMWTEWTKGHIHLFPVMPVDLSISRIFWE